MKEKIKIIGIHMFQVAYECVVEYFLNHKLLVFLFSLSFVEEKMGTRIVSGNSEYFTTLVFNRHIFSLYYTI